MIIGRQVATDYGKRIDLLAIDAYLNAYALPPQDRHRLGTTNALERLNQEIQRRTVQIRACRYAASKDATVMASACEHRPNHEE